MDPALLPEFLIKTGRLRVSEARGKATPSPRLLHATLDATRLCGCDRLHCSLPLAESRLAVNRPSFEVPSSAASAYEETMRHQDQAHCVSQRRLRAGIGAAGPDVTGELSATPLRERAMYQYADQRTTVSGGGKIVRLRIAGIDPANCSAQSEERRSVFDPRIC